MSVLKHKKILLGVTGSIAAYKSALLIRLLVKEGAQVRVVMTPDATRFITPLTLSVLCNEPVLVDFENTAGIWNNHVDLGLWADVMLIAPASANTLAKMAHGLCDNLLMACYLSAKCKVMFAPAMDRDMYLHPATTKNQETLLHYGNILIPPGEGELASGLMGKGRMAEPEEIIAFLQHFFLPETSVLSGKKVLINAGPTREAIDPVRYISNHSSGKMGYALAAKAAERGAHVILVSGPSELSTPHPGIHRINVISALEMEEACLKYAATSDVFILAAAVADYTPAAPASQKLKKSADTIELLLKKNPDIASHIGRIKRADQLLVGFALETENAIENGFRKLEAKNMDMLVLNSLQDEGAGFGTDTNKISLLYKNKAIKNFDRKEKTAVAEDILNAVEKLMS